jgi:hypothetical protein
MRRAFVHIGTPRTGTTSLQRVLTRHRAALAEAGVLYPDLTPRSAAEPHLSHQHLGEALAGRRPAREKRELLDRLDAALAETACDVAVISYESLCLIPASRGAPEILRAALARRGFAMTVVMTVKPQIEQLNSIYTWRMQFLREARGFAAFARVFEGARELDYGALLAPWRAAAEGAIGVPVRDATDARPLLTRVFAAMGLAERAAFAMGAEDAAVVENRSPGPVAVEVCRRLRAGGAALALGGKARATTREVELAVVAAGWDAASFVGPDAAVRARVAARWREANDRFAREVWGADWGARVAEAPTRAVNEIFGSAGAGAAEDVVRRVLAEACAGAGVRLRRPVAAGLMAVVGCGVRIAARTGRWAGACRRP